MKVNLQKHKQRVISANKRDILKIINIKAPLELSKQIIKIKSFNKSKIIASFISIKSEISMDFLNAFLKKNNKILALPVMLKKKRNLIFRKYNKKTILKKNRYGVYEPDKKSDELLPDFILTPCLAFDEFGYRLGYGGGYYDKTFAELKKIRHSFVSVIVAFDDQKVKNIVKNKYDQKINFILTEKKIYRL